MKWTPAWVVITILSLALAVVLIVPLFYSEALDEDGVEIYGLVAGGVVSMLANALGRYQGKGDN